MSIPPTVADIGVNSVSIMIVLLSLNRRPGQQAHLLGATRISRLTETHQALCTREHLHQLADLIGGRFHPINIHVFLCMHT
jgi:hypothetical protein